MAAGAIPPPLFFEHRRRVLKYRPLSICSESGILAEHPKNISASISRTVGTFTSARDRSLSKDI
jgi:hypothetical protein